MHESPDVPNYGTPGRGIRLKKGLVIAIEPMILAGSRYMQVLDDGWTAVTQDGKMAAHYENTVALTENGPQILTLRDWKGETE
jgi:methionyl aminopeptidase